jgi:hypothetical protein
MGKTQVYQAEASGLLPDLFIGIALLLGIIIRNWN